jgi:Lhr-like helicase
LTALASHDALESSREYARDTASFGEVESIGEILTQLIEHRKAFKAAMEEMDRREKEILRRLKGVEDSDRRQSATLKKAIVIGALIVLGAMGLKSLNNETLSAFSNVAMAVTAVGGFLISQKSQN